MHAIISNGENKSVRLTCHCLQALRKVQEIIITTVFTLSCFVTTLAGKFVNIKI